MRVKAPFFGLLTLVSCALFGCQAVSSNPNLLTLSGVSPNELDLGDELEIHGTGFPDGKSARVAFRGDLYRAGEKVERDAEIVARTLSGSSRTLSLVMTEALRRAFTGPSEDAKHCTFRGDIEVSFAPKNAGSAPVVGVLSDVVLDIEPSLVSPSVQRLRDKNADEALAFLGIALASHAERDCCVAAAVTGRAEAIGLRASDRLVDFDGVTITSKWDLVPSSHRRTSRLSFRRAGQGPLITREIDVQGYRSSAPSELAPALGLVGFAVVSLLLHSTRLGRPLAWLAHFLALRRREKNTLLSAGKASKPSRLALLALPEDGKLHLVSAMLLVAVVALTTAIGFRIELVSRELDLLLFCLSQTVSLVWASLLISSRERPSPLRAALRAVSATLLHQVPILSLVVFCIFEAKSLRLFDLVEAQQALPLGWNAFRSPAGFLLVFLSVAALVPVMKLGRRFRAATTPLPGHSPGFWSQMAYGTGQMLSGTVHLWVSSLLIALLGFGGYNVPNLGGLLPSTSVSILVLGVFLLLLKMVAVSASVIALRAVTDDVRVSDTLVAFRRQVPILIFAAIVMAWTDSWLSRRLALVWLEEVTAWVLLSTTVAALSVVFYRVSIQGRLARSDSGPNPWI